MWKRLFGRRGDDVPAEPADTIEPPRDATPCSCCVAFDRGAAFDESWTVRVPAADGFAVVRLPQQGLAFDGGAPWRLHAVLALLPRRLVRVRVGTPTGRLLGGTLPQMFDGLRAAPPASWDGILVLENDPADAAVDHFVTFRRWTGQ